MVSYNFVVGFFRWYWRWGKDKELGVGSFGEVWRERELGGELRAVKTITKFILKSCKIDYKRELQVLVKVKDVPYPPPNTLNFASADRNTTSVSRVFRSFSRLV